jgi:hypothetical protein
VLSFGSLPRRIDVQVEGQGARPHPLSLPFPSLLFQRLRGGDARQHLNADQHDLGLEHAFPFWEKSSFEWMGAHIASAVMRPVTSGVHANGNRLERRRQEIPLRRNTS